MYQMLGHHSEFYWTAQTLAELSSSDRLKPLLYYSTVAALWQTKCLDWGPRLLNLRMIASLLWYLMQLWALRPHHHLSSPPLRCYPKALFRSFWAATTPEASK